MSARSWLPSERRPLSASLRRAVSLLTLTAVYFAAGKLGLALAFVHVSASAVWPPAGIAVGTLLVLGPGMWPPVAIGAFLVNVTTSGDVWSSLAIAAGNTLEALLAWWLVSRWSAAIAAFDRPGTTFTFALFGAGAATVAASIGVIALLIAGLATPRDVALVWLTWWLGDAAGIVLVTPLIVLWAKNSQTRVRSIELAAVLIAVTALGWFVFGNSPAGLRRYPLEFAAAAVLLWPAIRLGAREAATATNLLAVVAIAGTLQGFGPFARSSTNESLLLLQMFVGIVAVLMLAVASETAARKAAEAEAERSNHAKDVFLAVLSHELRTPLNAAFGWAHLLKDAGDDQVPRSKAVEAVLRNLRALARLVSDMMDASHIVLGSFRLDRAPVDIASLACDAAEMVRHPAAARGINVETDIQTGPIYVNGDAGRLHQVVGNLLANAVKFSPDNHTIRLRVAIDRDLVHLAVEDSGPGIPADFLPHIFDRFTQADASVRRRHGGLGLGLAIARHLVEAHGGRITAENRPTGGAVFKIHLPSMVVTTDV